jgi:hypothetical protein
MHTWQCLMQVCVGVTCCHVIPRPPFPFKIDSIPSRNPCPPVPALSPQPTTTHIGTAPLHTSLCRLHPWHAPGATLYHIFLCHPSPLKIHPPFTLSPCHCPLFSTVSGAALSDHYPLFILCAAPIASCKETPVQYCIVRLLLNKYSISCCTLDAQT